MARSAIEPALHWTDHYVKYGFAVLKNLLPAQYTDAALAQVQRHLNPADPQRALETMTESRENLACQSFRGSIVDQVYDQPGIRQMIDTMFASPDAWNGDRPYQVFVNVPREPQGNSELPRRGHLDFVKMPIPIFGSGFMFQVALKATEHLGGNIVVWPGSHIEVQRRLIDNPDRQFPADFADFPFAEPFEFIAEPGDVFLFHHLVFHEGTPCCGPRRQPRVNLHCQALHRQWLSSVDPAQPLSPWERSLAQNGAYRVSRDEEQTILEYKKLHPKRQIA